VEILQGLVSNRLRLIQPPHFFAEVAAALTREQPSTATRSLEDRWKVRWEGVESASIYRLAAELSIRLGHHLFDTLYHAAALTHREANLITADERYYKKARGQGRITRLAEFSLT